MQSKYQKTRQHCLESTQGHKIRQRLSSYIYLFVSFTYSRLTDLFLHSHVIFINIIGRYVN